MRLLSLKSAQSVVKQPLIFLTVNWTKQLFLNNQIHLKFLVKKKTQIKVIKTFEKSIFDNTNPVFMAVFACCVVFHISKDKVSKK